jgi:hypothetical protein
VNQDILQLLAGTNPGQAREFVLSFSEHRAASWADAQRQASLRAASHGHLPHYRGQLRYQLGETALLNAAQIAKAGCIPIRTVRPGSTFMVARVGRFGLVSVTVRDRRYMPRPSATRRLLSDPNEELDPQRKLHLTDKMPSRGATELAYFGCMIACPSIREPGAPAQMVFGIPNARLSDWIEWVPLQKLYAALEDLVSKDGQSTLPHSKPIPDRRYPTLRLPKDDRSSGGEGE